MLTMTWLPPEKTPGDGSNEPPFPPDISITPPFSPKTPPSDPTTPFNPDQTTDRIPYLEPDEEPPQDDTERVPLFDGPEELPNTVQLTGEPLALKRPNPRERLVYRQRQTVRMLGVFTLAAGAVGLGVGFALGHAEGTAGDVVLGAEAAFALVVAGKAAYTVRAQRRIMRAYLHRRFQNRHPDSSL